MVPVDVIFGAVGVGLGGLLILGGIVRAYRPSKPIRVLAVHSEQSAPVPDRNVVYLLFGCPCHSWVIVKAPVGEGIWEVAAPRGATFCTGFMCVRSDNHVYTYVRGYWLNDLPAAAPAAPPQPAPPKDPTDG